MRVKSRRPFDAQQSELPSFPIIESIIRGRCIGSRWIEGEGDRVRELVGISRGFHPQIAAPFASPVG